MFLLDNEYKKNTGQSSLCRIFAGSLKLDISNVVSQTAKDILRMLFSHMSIKMSFCIEKHWTKFTLYNIIWLYSMGFGFVSF